MKKIRQWFSKQKLNMKFTVIIGMFVFIPMVGIMMLLFQNLRDNTSKQVINNLKYSMNQTYGVVQKTVDLCNTSTQVFLGYKNLTEFLAGLKTGEEIETIAIMDFYKNDIGMLENIVNSNPYLYQIRVYANSNQFSEMMPILFQESRMKELEWSENYISGEWQFDYQDAIFLSSVNSSKHTMGLITKIEDFDLGEVGVIEVAVRMEDVFEKIFQSNANDWIAFVDSEGRIYSGSVEENIWESNKETIVKEILLQQKEETYYQETILNNKAVVGVLPIKELSGTLIHIVNMAENNKEMYKTQMFYMTGIMIGFAVLIVLINQTVKVLLRQFYKVLGTIFLIQEGDLAVRINQYGNDEMGQLGLQIDKMLDTIDRLMHESIRKELLMKNSEIKALQNQINAHFIYNVLESIKMMAEIDEKYEISDAVTSLGKLLRYGMKWTAKNVTVEQEIEYIKDYLNLINLRFDYEIHLSLNISENLYKQEIPKISLQPIVENAIYHGIEELAEDASIYIKAFLVGNDFVIEITDSGKGMSEEEVEQLKKKISGEIETEGGAGNGIGLKNVQDRIRISFGNEYGISILSKEKCYTKVVVKLPITNKEVRGNE